MEKKEKYKFWKLLNVSLILGLILIIWFLSGFENKDIGGEKIVTKIIDGDTIIIQGGEKIRLLGIDCDERGKPCYKEAKEFLEEFLLDEKILLEKDIEDKDRYSRSLRYVFLDGENINLKLIKKGLCIARFERDGAKYQKEIINAEEIAIKNRIGCKWE